MTIESVKHQNQMSGTTTGRTGVAGAEMVEVSKFPRMLQLYQEQVERALPVHLKNNVDRYTRIALSEFRNTPRLVECDPLSVFAAVIMASQLGWELGGVLGQAYLVPYGNECNLIPGWKGLVDLVHRAGRAVAWTGCVFQGDDFEYQLGDSPYVRHIPRGEDDPEKIVAAYAVGKIRGMEHYPICEVWPKDKLIRHRDRYNKVGPKHYSFENMEMYVRKVVLLQNIKYLPVSAEMNTALVLDAAYETGQRQSLSISAAAEGLVLPSNGIVEKHVEQTVAETVTPAAETKAPETVIDTKLEEEKKTQEQRELEAKAREKAKADKEAKEKDALKKAAEKLDVKSSEPSSPAKKKDSEVATKADEPPDWAKVAPKAETKKTESAETKVVTATPEQVEKAAEQAPAPVEIVEPLGERKRSNYKDMLGIPMPEFITRLSNEPGPSEEQMAKANEEMKLINGPTGEATLENTVKEWLKVEVHELTQETMEIFIQVLAKFRESRQ